MSAEPLPARLNGAALSPDEAMAALQCEFASRNAVRIFSKHGLKCWRVLQEDDRAGFDAMRAELHSGQRAVLEQRLREFEAAESTQARESVDDWPGSGEVGELLRTEPPPIEWFGRERLLADRAHVLAGLGGTSKTRMQYHLAIGAVLGRLPWGWQIDRTGSAALFLTEDTPEGVHRTLDAMVRSMRLSAAERARLAERLKVFGLAGKPSHLLLANPGGALVESWRVEQLLDILRGLPPPLVYVGLDPALGLTEGDEMNPAHQRKLGELADRIAIELRACVVLNTHAAKGLQTLEEIGSHSSRGSGAITDAVRGEFALRTMTAAEARSFGVDSIEERKSFVQLVAVKGNELPPAAFAPTWLRRGIGGVLEPAELVAREVPTVGKRETDALAILRGLAETAAPQMKVWRDACVAKGLLTGPTDRAREKAMERVRDALLAAGLIERGVGRGVFVPVAEETP